MEPSLIQTAGSLGIGAFLGALIFICYRLDRRDTEKRIHDIHEAHSERLEHLLEQDQDSRRDNTKALTELIVLISRLNGRLK